MLTEVRDVVSESQHPCQEPLRFIKKFQKKWRQLNPDIPLFSQG